jgi:hypothetical protein
MHHSENVGLVGVSLHAFAGILDFAKELATRDCSRIIKTNKNENGNKRDRRQKCKICGTSGILKAV